MQSFRQIKLSGLAALTVCGLLAIPASAAGSTASFSTALHGPHAARINTTVPAFKTPGGKRIATLQPDTPLTGGPSVFPIARTKTFDATDWLGVLLTGRPNGRLAWIPASSATVIRLHWRIRVDLSNRALAVFRDGKLVRRLRVVIGTKDTPTPTGHFHVVERVRLGTYWSRTGWALALSAFSNVLKHFDGGDGQVAIHARGTLDGALGSASSHGCIRLRNQDAAWMAHRITNGTPVDIVH
ncbi:MAG: L,D-transpeptidase [Solirubrobacterales bacterium]|nr:L,D-transpeptidase [Solirubrobacterales bacterium]